MDASRDLGVGKNTLQRWLKEHRTSSSSPQVLNITAPHQFSDLSQDVKRLRRENEILRQERDILKKALGIFSQASKERFPL